MIVGPNAVSKQILEKEPEMKTRVVVPGVQEHRLPAEPRVYDRLTENSFFLVFIWALRRWMIDECIWETRDSDRSSVAPISFMVISS